MRTPPKDTFDVQVTGRKWAWSFQYPNGASSDVLHVPVNRKVKLVMTSDDVIHSFYVPAFRIKQDVVPGRYTTQWFETTTTGQFPGVQFFAVGILHKRRTPHLQTGQS